MMNREYEMTEGVRPMLPSREPRMVRTAVVSYAMLGLLLAVLPVISAYIPAAPAAPAQR